MQVSHQSESGYKQFSNNKNHSHDLHNCGIITLYNTAKCDLQEKI